MGRISFEGLRVKSILLVLTAVLPLFVLIVYAGIQERTHSLDLAQRDALVLARNIAASQDDVIDSVRHILFFVAQMVDEHEHRPATFKQMFARLSQQMPELTGMIVARANGEVIAHTFPVDTELNISDRPIYRHLLQRKSFVIGEYQIIEPTGTPIVTLALPILNKDGEIKQIIATDIDLRKLNRSLIHQQLPEGAELTLIDSRGTVLLRHPRQDALIGQPLPEKDLANIIFASPQGVAQTSGPDGKNRLYGFAAFGQPAGTIYVSIGIPSKLAFAHADRTTLQHLFWFIIVTLLVLILAWRGSDVCIIRSLNRLFVTARLIGNGNLNARVGGPYGQGEIGQLTSAFDKMAAALQQREEENKQALAALLASEARYRSLVVTSPDAVFLVAANACIRMVNPQGISLLGYEREEEIVGRHILDFFPREEHAAAIENFEKTVAKASTRNVIYNAWKKNGRIFPVEINASVIAEESASPAVVAVVRDITARVQAEEELRAEEKKYHQLVDTLQEGIWAVDDQAVTTFVNDALAEMLGYRSEEMIGKPLFCFMEQRCQEDSGQHLARRRQGIKERYDFEFLKKDGTIVVTTLSASPLFDELGNFIGSMAGVVNITDRKQKEQQIQLHLSRLMALRYIDMAITGSRDLRLTLKVILEQVTGQLAVDAAIVLLLDHHSLVMEFAAGHGFQTSALRHTNLKMGDGLAGRAAMERHTMTARIPDEGIYMEQSPLLAKEGFQMHIAVPLISKGHVKGVLEIFHRTPLTPNPEWLDFLEALATQAAIAVDNAALFSELERANLDLVMAYDTTLEGWSKALDLRDKETEGHSRRVTEMTVRLARALGVHDSEIPHIRRGALLHDIGKMAIPDGILLKDGPLTGEEWEIMRKHPLYAYELLRPIDFLRLAIIIPYSHHEKWDGTGYPRGLKGETIPLAARIFAVVDVWDALSSERPYRPAWTGEKVFAYIKQEAGAYFDPQIVDVFLKLMSEPPDA